KRSGLAACGTVLLVVAWRGSKNKSARRSACEPCADWLCARGYVTCLSVVNFPGIPVPVRHAGPRTFSSRAPSPFDRALQAEGGQHLSCGQARAASGGSETAHLTSPHGSDSGDLSGRPIV